MNAKINLKKFVNFTVDQCRRDLRINSIMMDFEGNIYDPFGGVEDLKNGVVRFVGDADQRILDDGLRILRFFRFYARFGKEYDVDTLEAIKRNAPGLAKISRERIWSEMSKIISGPNGPDILDKMIECGLAPYIDFPVHAFHDNGIAALKNAYQNTKNPVTLLATYVGANFPAMKNLALDWKMSLAERDMALFLSTHAFDIPMLYEIKTWVVNGVPKEWVIEFCLSMDELTMAHDLRNWTVPVFPVNGRDLVQFNVQAGPGMGKILKELRENWMDSEFTLSKDDLLNGYFSEDE